ncbi:MAG TPA: sigma-70 family RNA polymerase sigma factor [Gemmatimonadaceae bacterium]|nr:sigma-70 family RNA polymerase sigma factor [Gemmatimonadaceae bacterium]
MSYDRETDDTLLARLARTRDSRAFDALYARHTQTLYAVALRLTRDSDAAADVVQDAWIRALDAAHRFERRSAFRTWIMGILINRVREHSRAQRREEQLDGDATEAMDALASDAEPLDGAQFDRLDLEAAIAALPPRFRQVLVLHDVEGFTHEEIAEMLGLVPGTSKSQLSRARRRMRELLESGVPRVTT